jgi:hypothetical protein
VSSLYLVKVKAAAHLHPHVIIGNLPKVSFLYGGLFCQVVQNEFKIFFGPFFLLHDAPE